MRRTRPPAAPAPPRARADRERTGAAAHASVAPPSARRAARSPRARRRRPPTTSAMIASVELLAAAERATSPRSSGAGVVATTRGRTSRRPSRRSMSARTPNVYVFADEAGRGTGRPRPRRSGRCRPSRSPSGRPRSRRARSAGRVRFQPGRRHERVDAEPCGTVSTIFVVVSIRPSPSGRRGV